MFIIVQLPEFVNTESSTFRTFYELFLERSTRYSNHFFPFQQVGGKPCQAIRSVIVEVFAIIDKVFAEYEALLEEADA